MRGGIAVKSSVLEVEPSTAEGKTRRTWVLQLECGDTVRRHVAYRPIPPFRGTRRPYTDADVLPPARHVHCPDHPPVRDDQLTRIAIRASPTAVAGMLALLRTAAPDLTEIKRTYTPTGFVVVHCETRATPPAPDPAPVNTVRAALDTAIQDALPLAGGQVRPLLEKLRTALAVTDYDRARQRPRLTERTQNRGQSQ